MADDGFTAHCLELLSTQGQARAKRMFGGVGLYVDDLFVALIADGRLYLKVDAQTRSTFEEAGGEAFVYGAKGKSVTMSYCSAPTAAMDGPAQMAPWARLAVQAAGAARAEGRSPRASRSVRSPGRR